MVRGQLNKAITRVKMGIVGCPYCRAWRCGAEGPDRDFKRTSKRARRRVDRLIIAEYSA